MASILEKMGMYGAEDEENYFLAAALTGDPLLMIGTHGCGKTYFSELIAACLGADYQVYDASKAMFEDVLGFPNPKSLSEGKIEYIPTPMSIIPKEFVLVDEISYANVQMQSKWLEIIRSRRIMGVKCPNLRWVWAAMNPLTYDGAVPLNEALAGRFSFVIIVPEACNMSEADAMSVVLNENGDDALALSEWGGSKSKRPPLPAEELRQLLECAGAHYNDIVKEKEAAISSYTVRLMRAIKAAKKFRIDGRRCGMIRRNILSVMAIKRAKGEVEDIDEIARETLLRSLPNVATGKKMSHTNLLAAHDMVASALHMKKDVNYSILVEKDLAKKLFLALTSREEVHPTTLHDLAIKIAGDSGYAWLAAVVTPMMLRFPYKFEAGVIACLCEATQNMLNKGDFSFNLNKRSVLSMEDYRAAGKEFTKTTTGIIAMRVTAEVFGNRGADTLDAFVKMAHSFEVKITDTVEQLQPLYDKMLEEEAAGTDGDQAALNTQSV